jgi:ubiquinone/menaquinone biosynthesis C-methylase UbiE
MIARSSLDKSVTPPNLQLSRGFAVSSNFAGEAIVYDFADYSHRCRITDEERVLLSCFSWQMPVNVEDAITAFYRHVQRPQHLVESRQVRMSIDRFRHFGLLVEEGKRSVYGQDAVNNYGVARAIPPQVCNTVVEAAGLSPTMRALDIGTGAGDIALALSRVSRHVTTIDICDNFLELAHSRSTHEGLPLRCINGCGNKLIMEDETYDLITMSQVFHRLQPQLITNAVYRSLARNGSLIVLESKPSLPASHPLRIMLGYGARNQNSVHSECLRHVNQYMRLFDTLRSHSIVLRLSGMWLFRETRLFDLAFARSRFSSVDVASLNVRGIDESFQVDQLFVDKKGEQLIGRLFWLIMRFSPEQRQRHERMSELSGSDFPICQDEGGAVSRNRCAQQTVLVGHWPSNSDAMSSEARNPCHGQPDAQNSPVSITTAIGSYLSEINPRLSELRGMYAALSKSHDALRHTRWTDEYVSREVVLSRFRDDGAFMWQRKDHNLPVHYLCTYYFARAQYPLLMTKCTEDDLFGVFSMRVDGQYVTRDRLDSVMELSFLTRQLKLNESQQFTMLDIGSGYGRLAYRIAQCFPHANILCTDAIPDSLFLCEFYLRFRGVADAVTILPLGEVETKLRTSRVDVAVAINSLSECSGSAIRWWLSLLSSNNVPYLFVVPHRGFSEGREIMSVEDGAARVDLAQCAEEYGYVRIALEPKYCDPHLQRHGISPTHYHLFQFRHD